MSDVPTSFLFAVNELPANEDTGPGSVKPRTDDQGKWVPPLYAAGFGVQRHGDLYRWTDGVITEVTDFYRENGSWRGLDHNALEVYQVRTLFYCNPFSVFMVAMDDASQRDLISSNVPNDKWYCLSFQHDRGISRLEEGGQEQCLAGSNSTWIDQLGLAQYRRPRSRQPTGLGGTIALVVGLVALSCPEGSLGTILLEDGAWQYSQWRGHRSLEGSSHLQGEPRGVVVSIYYDPHNNPGSTKDILDDLSMNRGPMLQDPTSS